MPEEHPAANVDREGSPRTPAGVADERFAANIRERREAAKMSQADLAKAMAASGWHWYPQTVHRVETGARRVSVGEGKALAEILETTVDRLTWPGREASAASLLLTYTARAEQAYEQIADWAHTLRHCVSQLDLTVSQVERAGYLGSAEIRRLAADARNAMQLSAGDAIAEEEGEREEPGDERS